MRTVLLLVAFMLQALSCGQCTRPAYTKALPRQRAAHISGQYCKYCVSITRQSSIASVGVSKEGSLTAVHDQSSVIHPGNTLPVAWGHSVFVPVPVHRDGPEEHKKVGLTVVNTSRKCYWNVYYNNIPYDLSSHTTGLGEQGILPPRATGGTFRVSHELLNVALHPQQIRLNCSKQ
ncbi:hypothetical protein B0H21DRAFT_711963 [Amylocystis lapponica]|nr:hypothetical protein B0H21DRAFT_711963 [Amylocystis lapponica]